MSEYRLGTEQLENSLAEKIIDGSWASSGALAAKTAKSLLDCVRSCAASRLREVILPIYWALLRHFCVLGLVLSSCMQENFILVTTDSEATEKSFVKVAGIKDCRCFPSSTRRDRNQHLSWSQCSVNKIKCIVLCLHHHYESLQSCEVMPWSDLFCSQRLYWWFWCGSVWSFSSVYWRLFSLHVKIVYLVALWLVKIHGLLPSSLLLFP